MLYEFIHILLKRWSSPLILLFFFFNDTATTEIYTLSLHDALPIYDSNYAELLWRRNLPVSVLEAHWKPTSARAPTRSDRKSTRLNSSHLVISYAVFCLKKKNVSTASPATPPYSTSRCPTSRLRRTT